MRASFPLMNKFSFVMMCICMYLLTGKKDGTYSISNWKHINCLFSSLFLLITKKTLNSVTSGFPSQRANMKAFTYHDDIIIQLIIQLWYFPLGCYQDSKPDKQTVRQLGRYIQLWFNNISAQFFLQHIYHSFNVTANLYVFRIRDCMAYIKCHAFFFFLIKLI